MKEQGIREIEIKFESISNIGFLKRIFNWSSIKGELSKIKIYFSELARKISELQVSNEHLSFNAGKIQSQLEVKKAEERKNQEALNRLEVDKNSLQDKNNSLNEDKKNLQGELSSLKTKNEQLRKDAEEKMKKYEASYQRYENKSKEIEEKEKNKIEEKYKKLKYSWNQHEDRVQGAVKRIAEKLAIAYIASDKFEFAGRPDNSVLIADEYVIFDAKSPGNPEELNNFPSYLKKQVEQAKKYAKHNGVKKDIYLVIPENTLEVIEEFFYEVVDYRVHIITIQSLESVLRSLFKIEEYKTITDLNPEDRENFCRIIGRLSHASKRRIQIDAFFATALNEILKDNEKVIPAEMKERINEYEASDRYNPKLENKNKTIPIEEVENSVKEMQTVAFGQEINTDEKELKAIEAIPLSKNKKQKKLKK